MGKASQQAWIPDNYRPGHSDNLQQWKYLNKRWLYRLFFQTIKDSNQTQHWILTCSVPSFKPLWILLKNTPPDLRRIDMETFKWELGNLGPIWDENREVWLRPEVFEFIQTSLYDNRKSLRDNIFSRMYGVP